jgi:transposase
LALDVTREVYLNVGMAYGHDLDFRERVVAAHADGKGGAHTLAEVFGIGYRTVQRWLARQRATGSVAATPGSGGWKSSVDPGLLTTLIREVPDATAAELCAEYNRRVDRGARASMWAIGRARRRLGFVCKKNGRGQVRWIGPTSRRSGKRSSAG